MVPTHADSQVIWMDGKLLPYAEARVHVLCHSLHYGSGAFEGMRAYETVDGKSALFRGKEHYERFFDSIRAFGYHTEYSVADLMQATVELVQANQFRKCYVRPIAYIDDSVRGLRLPENPRARIAIAAWNWGKYLGAEGQKHGIRVMVSTYRRQDVASSLPFAKLTGGYLTSVLARSEATQHGMDEAILLDPHGFVAEGSGENLFLIKGGEILTPTPGYILPGITRNSVIELARGMGYTVRETSMTRNELYLADELFFTGTAVEITPIREVDHRPIGSGKPGPITQRLFDQFFKILRGEVPEYRRWLTLL